MAQPAGNTLSATLFHWSREEAPNPAQVIAAVFGLAGPILVGALTGHSHTGLAISLGGLPLAGSAPGGTLRDQARNLSLGVLVGSAALGTGNFLGHDPFLSLWAFPLVGALAGLIGGISMTLVSLMARFVVFTAISISLGAQGAPLLGSALLFGLGALWTGCVFLTVERVFRAGSGRKTATALSKMGRVVRQPTMSGLLKRWRGTLRGVAGWQFAIRLGSCLAVAEAVAWVWPWPHGYWIALTVAITLERRLPAAPVRLLERLVGTTIGVVLAGVLMLGSPPVWALIGMVAILAAARSVFRSANYTAYATVMTPLIILLMDFDKPPSVDVLVDRLAGTGVGCAITLVLGYLAWARYAPARSRGA